MNDINSIVSSFAKINFQPTSTENREHNENTGYFFQFQTPTMAPTRDAALTLTDDLDANQDQPTISGRRIMPPRMSKESSFLKIKRRSIMKPAKRNNNPQSISAALRPADIKKIYLNKKLKKFKPTSLETIFEDPSALKPQPKRNLLNTINVDAEVRLIGEKKIRRTLSCCDGLNTTKALLNQRRAKIKKSFGRRYALKKISLDDFLVHLSNSLEEGNNKNENIEQPASQPASDESEMATGGGEV